MKILPSKKKVSPTLVYLDSGRVFLFEGNYYMTTSKGESVMEVPLGYEPVVELASGKLCEMREEALVTPLPHAVLCPEGLPEGAQS